MKLSSLYDFSNIPDYLEYAWVCAPNAAAQTLTGNTITTLTLDTEVVDEGGHGSIASNQVTLAAGTYAYEASAPAVANTGDVSLVLGLYNVTSSKWVGQGNSLGSSTRAVASGQFTIEDTTVFDVRGYGAATNPPIKIQNAQNSEAYTLSTTGAEFRTNLKLWKLA